MTQLKIMQVHNTPTISHNNYNKRKIQNNEFLKYAGASTLGAGVGFLTKLKPVEGPDKLSYITKGRKAVLMKTLVPDWAGMYRNALIGAFVGILTVGLYNLIKNRKSKQ